MPVCMGVGRAEDLFDFGKELVEGRLELTSELTNPPGTDAILLSHFRRAPILGKIHCHASVAVAQFGGDEDCRSR